ncbi:2-oxoglutarate dehydrogenase, mitochondrial-like isoform X4 [Apis laboriosa]|uniref:2-oxoglutarate dehydrogenase, mitochondrial-like isoform X4 n=1 Tax=Apis laboriosa TaxID=183418 RepID=UPI001CC4DE54|nr:2-oxoglutarate dehydrogenase, mitochondrial-like isoform X4 [Apis laboriosa]
MPRFELIKYPSIRLLAYINKSIRIDHYNWSISILYWFQARGHLIADTDPLGIQNPESRKLQGTPNLPPAIVVRQHLKGMTEADMNREFPLAPFTVIGGPKRSLPLRDILIRLNQVYCGHLGLEYTYIHDLVMLDWLRDKFEIPGAWDLPEDHRKFIWMNIMKAVTFEGFLARKFPTEKRFGLEGCESFIPSMNQCLETSAEHGVESVVIGMAHRGRLNTLINVCMKPLHQLLTQFHSIALEGFGSGDVKYHLGTHAERMLERSKKKIRVAMMANPSHLEAIDPVVVGRVRAEQVEKNDAEFGKKSMAFLVHGDAAFSGQGIVYETMHLTNLPNYTTGGVIHIVINNQIGFTTDPRYSRSSAHCTDVARVVNAPIFHIHADDPDLVTYCSKVASEYRAEFHNDVVLDIVGYRRFGHNELDEPMLTQPLMYKRIKQHPNVLNIYSDKLFKEGVITEAFAKEEIEKYWNYCETEFEKAKTIDSMQLGDWHDIPWNDFFATQSPKNKIPSTGIDIETIKTICKAISTPPNDIESHTQVKPGITIYLSNQCVMTPKSLLRHPMALSPFADMESGTSFKPILSDPFVKPGNIQKVLMCSGKVFYDLVTERQGKQLVDKIAIIRIEQLCPFPYHLLAEEMKKYPNAKLMWLQEEHKNQGPYLYVRDRIALALGIRLEDLAYGGRPPSSSPATGSKVIHRNEYNDMITMALKLD